MTKRLRSVSQQNSHRAPYKVIGHLHGWHTSTSGSPLRLQRGTIAAPALTRPHWWSPIRDMPASGDAGGSVMLSSGEASGGTIGTYKGRRFVSKNGPATNLKIPKNVNLDGLHHAMAEDSTAIDILKREVLTAQETEAQESFGQLEMLKRAHDKLYFKAEELEATNGKRFGELEIVKKVLKVKKVITISEHHLAWLQAELRRIGRRYRDAITRKKTTQFMVKRITKIFDSPEEFIAKAKVENMQKRQCFLRREDVMEVKKDVKLFQAQLQAAVSEAASSECQLQQSRQELKTEQDKLKKLRRKVGQRTILQGESLTDLQHIFEERSVQLLNQEERIHQRDDLLTKPGGGVLQSEGEGRLLRKCVVRKLYSSILQKKVEEEQRHLEAYEDTFQQIKNTTGLSDVDEIIERYQMRAGKNQQLHLMAEEIRQRIESLRKENQQQKQWLDDSCRVQEATFGNRVTYQEVDIIDVALGSARKQCDDAKERANRLSVTVDHLRDSLSRFMSKVDSKTHPVAPQSKLPEVMAQLDSKITHMMKAISSALVKDERGGGGGDGWKESAGGVNEAVPGDSSAPAEIFSKLDNARVMKILYQNTMSTQPDTSPRNVRVTPRKAEEKSAEKRINMKILLGEEYVSDGEEPDSEEVSEGEPEDARDTFVNRMAVKKLSKLALGRDTKSRGTRRGKRLRRKDG